MRKKENEAVKVSGKSLLFWGLFTFFAVAAAWKSYAEFSNTGKFMMPNTYGKLALSGIAAELVVWAWVGLAVVSVVVFAGGFRSWRKERLQAKHNAQPGPQK
jgi:hypothetical protein